jgi:pimeloyl-ACP methyl ester carboxylesterase
VTAPTAGPTPTRLAMGSGEISLFRQGSGRPVLFLHAAGGAGEWSPFHEKLSQHVDLIAPDHPGFGRSDELPEVGTMDQLVAHYVALLDKLGIDRLDVVGASFGGWTAAELVSTIPDRVDHLVLMAPAGLDVPEAPPANLFEMAPPDLVRALFYDDAVVEAALSVPPTPEQIAQTEKDMSAFARFARDPYLHNPALRGRLPRITARTLVIAAEVDVIIPRAHSEAYAEAIPGATLRELPRAAHGMHHERPDEAADAVLGWLDDSAQPPTAR